MRHVRGSSDRIGLLKVRRYASFTKLSHECGAQIGSADVDHFHYLLPAFQAVDITGVNKPWPETAGNAALIVITEVRARFRAQCGFKEHLHAGLIEPRWIRPQRFTNRQRRITVHGDIDKRVDMRISTEVEDCRRTL